MTLSHLLFLFLGVCIYQAIRLGTASVGAADNVLTQCRIKDQRADETKSKFEIRRPGVKKKCRASCMLDLLLLQKNLIMPDKFVVAEANNECSCSFAGTTDGAAFTFEKPEMDTQCTTARCWNLYVDLANPGGTQVVNNLAAECVECKGAECLGQFTLDVMDVPDDRKKKLHNLAIKQAFANSLESGSFTVIETTLKVESLLKLDPAVVESMKQTPVVEHAKAQMGNVLKLGDDCIAAQESSLVAKDCAKASRFKRMGSMDNPDDRFGVFMELGSGFCLGLRLDTAVNGALMTMENLKLIDCPMLDGGDDSGEDFDEKEIIGAMWFEVKTNEWCVATNACVTMVEQQ